MLSIVRRISNNSGSAIGFVVVAMLVIGVLVYFFPNLIIRGRQSINESERALEAQILASDLKEIGKYLFLYEKIFYMNEPLRNTPARLNHLKSLFPQSMGQLSPSGLSLINVCGGYTALAEFVGNLKIDSEPVFCPFYFRNTMMSGQMLEDMVLSRWATHGTGKTKQVNVEGGRQIVSNATIAEVVKQVSPGHYRVEIEMTDSLINDQDNYFQLNMGQRILKPNYVPQMRGFIYFDIYTDSSGFESKRSERFIKISSKVNFYSLLRKVGEYQDSESFIMNLATIKDFAIFLPYPTNSQGQATNRFSQSVRIGNGSHIYGRVLFHGNIDTDSIDNLPTFHEQVVISGKLVNRQGNPIENLSSDRLRQKFHKGLVTDYPLERMLFDGDCNSEVGNVRINNQSQIYCNKPNDNTRKATIYDYIDNLLNICSKFQVTMTNTGNRLTYPIDTDSIVRQQCSGSANKNRAVKGGYYRVDVSHRVAYILSPVGKLVTTDDTKNLYGVMVGGYIGPASGNKLIDINFRSLSNLKVGLPGIPDQSVLDEWNILASTVLEGIAVPLVNIPLITGAKEGIQ